MSDYMEHPDYATIVDALAEGVRESTRHLIDCLGITVKLAELESWDEYERLRRKMRGGFTATRLYRALFPRRYRRLYRAYIDAQLAVQQEFVGKVLAGRDGCIDWLEDYAFLHGTGTGQPLGVITTQRKDAGEP